MQPADFVPILPVFISNTFTVTSADNSMLIGMVGAVFLWFPASYTEVDYAYSDCPKTDQKVDRIIIGILIYSFFRHEKSQRFMPTVYDFSPLELSCVAL